MQFNAQGALRTYKRNQRRGKPMQLLIRSFFSLLLIYMIYTETGPFTAIAFFLIFLSTEMILKMVEGDDDD